MEAGDFIKESHRMVEVVGTPSRWSVVPPGSNAIGSRQVAFRIFIQVAGNQPNTGFHLCYESESEAFAADDWYPTLAEAEHKALALFGITENDWVHAT